MRLVESSKMIYKNKNNKRIKSLYRLIFLDKTRNADIWCDFLMSDKYDTKNHKKTSTLLIINQFIRLYIRWTSIKVPFWCLLFTSKNTYPEVFRWLPMGSRLQICRRCLFCEIKIHQIQFLEIPV